MGTVRTATPSTENARAGSDSRWAAEPVGCTTVHIKLASFGKMLLEKAKSRHTKNRARVRIYRGAELERHGAALQALEQHGVGIARLNASKSIVDTFVSRLSKDRPMPAVRAVDGDWKRKRQAERFHEFIVGKMLETKFDSLSRDSVLDAAILGNGLTRIDDGECDLFAENMPVNEVLFDARECRYGMPRTAVRVRRVARDELQALYPDHKTLIEFAPSSMRRYDESQEDIEDFGDLSDYVDTYEAWKLPTSVEAADGRTALVLENVTLCFEQWHEPRFPWSHFRMFKPQQTGLWGDGFIDQLASLQHRVNCIVRDLQLNLAATGRGHFLVNEQNDIPTEMLTGWQPFKLKYKGGQPPTYVTPTPFNPAQLNMLEFFINQMFDLTGVSKANATSKSALGPGASGVALDTQYDIDSDRFRLPQGNYQDYRLAAGQCIIDASARIARRREELKGKKKSYVAMSFKNADSITRLDYSKVELAEGTYTVQIEAENFLPNTKSGKLAVVEQLAKAGVIPQWLVPSLFNEPDLVQANRLILAGFKNTMRKVDVLIDEDQAIPVPEVYNDLDLEMKIMVAMYNAMQVEEAPEEVQDRFRQYIDLITDSIKQKNATSQTPPGAMAPGGEPMAPAEGPMPGGVPAMPQGPVPAPAMIGAPPMPLPA